MSKYSYVFMCEPLHICHILMYVYKHTYNREAEFEYCTDEDPDLFGKL